MLIINTPSKIVIVLKAFIRSFKLAGTKQYMMLWGFLSPSVSRFLKDVCAEDLWMWGKDYKRAARELELKMSDFRFHSKIFDMDERMINAYRERSLVRSEI